MSATAFGMGARAGRRVAHAGKHGAEGNGS